MSVRRQVNYSISLIISNRVAVSAPLINITRAGLVPKHEQGKFAANAIVVADVALAGAQSRPAASPPLCAGEAPKKRDCPEAEWPAEVPGSELTGAAASFAVKPNRVSGPAKFRRVLRLTRPSNSRPLNSRESAYKFAFIVAPCHFGVAIVVVFVDVVATCKRALLL